MNSRFSLTKHASSSGGTLRELSQKKGWRESLARWFTGGLSSLLSMLLLSFGLIVPTQAASIFNYPGPLTINTVLTAESPKVTYPDSDDLDLTNTDFTLNACVSQTHYQNGHVGPIMNKRKFVQSGGASLPNSAWWGADGWFFGIENDVAKTPSQLAFRVGSSVLRSNTVLSLNQSYHVAAVYKKSGTAEIFINGQSAGTGSFPSVMATDQKLRIGHQPTTQEPLPPYGWHYRQWNGTLSKLQIDNTAISPNEIKKLDANCRGISIFDLTVTKTGEGTVTGQDISCGTQCTTPVTKDTSLTLTATPSTGYVFTGWTGGCTGTSTTCQVSMTQAKTVTATFKPLLNLTVTKTGEGTVTGQSINCGTQCVAQVVKDTSVTLTAAPSTGYAFTGWTGACTGTVTTCQVSMIQAQSVTATFKPTLTVTKTGTGTVSSNPTGISCGSDCTENYALNSVVTLTAAPTTGFTFAGWSGGCTGTTTTCQVTMNQAKTVTATFKPILTVTKTGSGSGTVSSNPAGISCGSDCTESYALNTVVTLTATADAGYTFANWSGDCTGTATTCQVTMNQAKTVNALFIIPNVNIEDTSGDGYACIAGIGLGIRFSWLLRDNNGKTVASNLNAQTILGDTPIGIAIEFGKDIKTQQGGLTSLPVEGNCIGLGNYTLLVGPPGATPPCQVTSAGCHFNPTIKFVPKAQILTSIRGFVWNDLNGNGLQDLQETYLPEWTVVLKNPNGVETTTVSDANGYYEVTGLSAGNYTVMVETRTGATYTTRQSMTRTVDSVNIPRLANFGITGEVEVLTKTNDNGTFNPDKSVVISNGDTTMVVTPNPTPGPETDIQLVDKGNDTYTGTNGLLSIEVKPNDSPTPGANDNEFTIVTGKEVTGTGEASSVEVTTNPDGSHSIADENFPGMAMILHDDGTTTVTDTESPGMVATLNSDGSSSVTDEASPGTVFTVTPEGTSTVTDTAYPDLTTTINPDGSTTVTDITAPGLEITLQPDGRSIVKDTTTGMTAERNSDGTYNVIDPEAPGIITIVNPTDGTAQVIDQATGECVTADSVTKRGTRSFGSFFKKAVNKATNFVSKVAGRVNKAAQKVHKVASAVNKAANFITKYAHFINKIASNVQSWALGRAASAGPIGNCIFCAVANMASKIAGITAPNSRLLKFALNLAKFSQKVMQVSSTVSKVATIVSKLATVVRNVVNAVGKFFGWNTLHLRSVRADTSPNCPIVTPDEGPYSASGTIKDKFGPVAGVTVQIAGKTTTTDASGNWQITGLTAGNELPLVALGVVHADVIGNNQVVVGWQTLAEVGNTGFNVYRAPKEADGQCSNFTKVNDALIPSQVNGTGEHSYAYEDQTQSSSKGYCYGIESVDTEGTTFLFENRVVKATVPTLVTLGDFTATPATDSILLKWETTSEEDTAGFNLWRAKAPADGKCTSQRVEDYTEVTKLNLQLIANTGAFLQGASYSYKDRQVASQTTYCYGLEEINWEGMSTFYWGWLISAMAH